MKTLQQQLRTIKETSSSNEEIDEKLNRFIDIQMKIIEYIKDLNDLVAYICLADFLSFGMMLIALLFLLNTVSFPFALNV